MFSKIDTVHISVSDLNRAREWYKTVLELEEIFQKGAILCLRWGREKLQ